jgi:UDP:flavonoid glycosyltransferase YjiC (YdhE family)
MAGIPQHQGTICFLPNQPMLPTEDLPWLIGTLTARKARFKFWTRTLDRSRTLRWVLVNSFPDEYIDVKQNQLVKSSQFDHPLVFPIGPLSKHVMMTKNPSFWEEDKSCLDWLDKQKANSVIYISFGSWVSPIGEGKVKNLALALEASGRRFLWVLGSAWREGLPNGYLERVGMQGKVVSWAPQMEVLQHKAVGCYLTHCGWNSTMEAIQCQKRLLCYPVAGDQFINNKYIVEVWKIGVKLNGFGLKDVEEGLRRVMEDSEMQNRLRRLHERTMGEEAKSRVMSNLTAFIDHLNILTIETPIKSFHDFNF